MSDDQNTQKLDENESGLPGVTTATQKQWKVGACFFSLPKHISSLSKPGWYTSIIWLWVPSSTKNMVFVWWRLTRIRHRQQKQNQATKLFFFNSFFTLCSYFRQSNNGERKIYPPANDSLNDVSFISEKHNKLSFVGCGLTWKTNRDKERGK